jgi:hypothetical protein
MQTRTLGLGEGAPRIEILRHGGNCRYCSSTSDDQHPTSEELYPDTSTEHGGNSEHVGISIDGVCIAVELDSKRAGLGHGGPAEDVLLSLWAELRLTEKATIGGAEQFT